MPVRIPQKEFEALVEEALRRVPDKFRERLRNVVMTVEDMPTRDVAEELGIPPDELLGLFLGATDEERESTFDIPCPFPDEIVLYQKNLEHMCDSKEELIEEIRETVVHEIGHYFGLSDDDMESFGE